MIPPSFYTLGKDRFNINFSFIYKAFITNSTGEKKKEAFKLPILLRYL